MHWVIIIFSFSAFMAATVGWAVWCAIRQRGPRVAIVTSFVYTGLVGGYFFTGMRFYFGVCLGDSPGQWDDPLPSLLKGTCWWGVLGTMLGLVATRILLKNERNGE
jgi:hypothetical protein